MIFTSTCIHCTLSDSLREYETFHFLISSFNPLTIAAKLPTSNNCHILMRQRCYLHFLEGKERQRENKAFVFASVFVNIIPRPPNGMKFHLNSHIRETVLSNPSSLSLPGFPTDNSAVFLTINFFFFLINKTTFTFLGLVHSQTRLSQQWFKTVRLTLKHVSQLI